MSKSREGYIKTEDMGGSNKVDKRDIKNVRGISTKPLYKKKSFWALTSTTALLLGLLITNLIYVIGDNEKEYRPYTITKPILLGLTVAGCIFTVAVTRFDGNKGSYGKVNIYIFLAIGMMMSVVFLITEIYTWFTNGQLILTTSVLTVPKYMSRIILAYFEVVFSIVMFMLYGFCLSSLREKSSGVDVMLGDE